MNKKAGIYDPYLDTLGGGERYCLTVAECLLAEGYQVDLFWSGNSDVINNAVKRFDLKLDNLNLVPDIFREKINNANLNNNPASLTKIISRKGHGQSIFKHLTSFITKYKITKKYDVFFYVSDWSMPFLFSRNNFLHIQVPFSKTTPLFQKLVNSFKTLFLKNIICNSNFTRHFAQKEFGDKCLTLYPPVDITKFTSSTTKENIILSVGRFDNLLNSKKQEVLIDAFKIIFQQRPSLNWKLILAGGSLTKPEENSYLQFLKQKSLSLPIEFIINPDFATLQQIYSSAKIYWHAAGYEIDSQKYPENTEHFGIAPVEAMASMAVPVVVSQGGLPEIVNENENGFLWKNIEQLISKTNLLIDSPQKLNSMAQAAKTKSENFSKEYFTHNFLKLISK